MASTMKKATSLPLWMMVSIILAIVMLLGMFNFLWAADKAYKNKAYSEECNNWIKFYMMGNKFFTLDRDESPCKAEQYTVQGKSEFEMLSDVMEKQIGCYNSYQRGDREMFKEVSGDITFCAVCYEINFTTKGKKIDALKYLDAYKLRADDNSVYMYAFAPNDFAQNFLDDSSFSENFEANALLKETAIDTDKKYVTIFVYGKGKDDIMASRQGRISIAKGAFFVNGLNGFSKYNEKGYTAALLLAELAPSVLSEITCDEIIGIQQPGITG